MKQVIVYTRVSSEKQAEEGTSLDTQRQACLKKAQELGASVVECLADEGISGGTLAGRPGLLRALAMIEEGVADVLLCYDLSRLSRSVEHQSIIKRRVEAAGGRLLFVMGQYADDEEGELFYTIDGGFKQYERRVIRRRTMGGRKKRAEEGIQPTRTTSPYGYQLVTRLDVLRGDQPASVLGQYLVHETEAAAVRRMFADYAAGASLRGLTLMLNTDMVPTRRGAAWSATVVRGVLTNPLYIGKPTFGQTRTVKDESRLDRRKSTGEAYKHASYRVNVPIDEQITLTAPALVDQETFALCQELLATNRATKSGNPQRTYLLSTTIRCPRCGKGLAGKRGGDFRWIYYTCQQRKVCDHYHTPAAVADYAVLHGIVNASRNPELFANAIAAYTEPDDSATTAEAERLRRDLATLQQQETATAKAQVDALIAGRSTEVYDRLLSEIDTKRKALQARLSLLDTKPKPPLYPKTDANKIAQALQDVEEVLLSEEVPTAVKRAALRRVLHSVRVEGETFVLEIAAFRALTVSSIRLELGPIRVSAK